MGKRKVRLLDKKLVHKYKEENVLLHHLRRALPLSIDADTFEHILMKEVSGADRKVLSQYYNPVEIDSGVLFYSLSGIMGSIKKEIVKSFIDQKQFTDEEIQTLLKFYEFDDKSQKYLLKRNGSIIEEIRIHKIMKQRDHAIIDQNYRERMARILELVQGFEKKEIFTSNMYVDTNHHFFFEHPCDHVPALMLIEGARQMLLACCHTFGHVPLVGMNLLLSGMHINFKRYLEFNFPIKLVARVNELKKRKDNVWIYVDMTIFFFQRNDEAAVLNFMGKGLSSKLFEYIRLDNFNYGYVPRFRIEEDSYDEMVLRDDKDKEYSGQVVDLSKSGFQMDINKTINDRDDNKIYSFFIKFRDIGQVMGKCRLCWIEHLKDKDFYYAGFEIVELRNRDAMNLDSALKKYCYVRYDRKFIETDEEESPVKHTDE